MSIEILSNIAYISTGIFIVYFILMMVGVEIDFGVEAGIFSFLSFQGILIGTMSFSWGALFFSQHIESSLGIAWAAIGVSFVFIFIFKIMFIFLRKTSTEFGMVGFKPKMGMEGKVYLTIPANEEFGGQVLFEDSSLGSYTLNVLTKEANSISTGDTIIIDDIIVNEGGDGETVYVKSKEKKEHVNKKKLGEVNF